MDTKHKIILYLLLLGVGITIYFSMCSKSPNDQLDKALLELDSAQKHLDSALIKIEATRIIIDTMRNDFNNFQIIVDSMRTDVNTLNKNSAKSEKNFRTSLSDLKIRNQQMLKQLKVNNDSLPEIKIIN